jgi:hypothetical protein
MYVFGQQRLHEQPCQLPKPLDRHRVSVKQMVRVIVMLQLELEKRLL